MCDCDCELPKEKKWQQIRDEALTGTNTVAVPLTGEFLVRDGKVMPVLESEMQDYVEGDVSYLVWVEADDA